MLLCRGICLKKPFDAYLISIVTNGNLNESLLPEIGKCPGGKDFLSIYGRSISLKEVIWILNYIDGFTEERVINELLKSNPEIANKIMQNLFILEDIVLFNQEAMKKLWEKIDEEILLTSMIDLPSSVRKHMLLSYPQSVKKEKLLSMIEIETDKSAIKSARHFVVEEIKSMVDSGAISIDRSTTAS